MSEKNEHNAPKPATRWPWIVLLLFLLFLGGLRWALQADMVLNIMREQAERIGSEQLNGTVHIGSLRGDLFGELTITDVRVQDEAGEMVLEFDTLYIRYRIWSLLRGPFEINEITLSSPRIYASQPAEDEWNLISILPEMTDTTETDGVFAMDIQSIRIRGGFIRVHSPYLLPDNEISVDSLQLDGAFSLNDAGFKASLSSLELQLIEGRLPEPIALQLSAVAEDNRYSLNQLSIATGRTFLEATARYADEGEEIRVDASARPFSWRDVFAYTDQPVFVEDIRLGLEVRGGLRDLFVGLQLDAAGLENGYIGARVAVDDGFRVLEAEVRADMLNVARLTGDSEMPSFGQIRFDATGDLRPEFLEGSVFEGNLLVERILVAPYRLDRVEGNFALDMGVARADFVAVLGGERIGLRGDVDGVFAELPRWSARLESTRIEVGKWAGNENIAVFAQLNIEASGVGFEPGAESWKLDAKVNDMLIDDQPVQQISLNAEITDIEAHVYSVIKLETSELDFNASLENWQNPEAVAYSFYLETSRLDLRDIVGFKNFPTAINLRALGTGTGIDPETMTVQSSLEMDDSIINGADIERFQANLLLENGLLTLDDTFLNSTLATGQLDVRARIADAYSRENRMDFNLEIGQLNPLAPLVGVEFLDASGKIEGSLTTGIDGVPTIEALLQLRDVTVDDLFASRIEGSADLQLRQQSTFDVDIRLTDASSGEFAVDNIQLTTRGTSTDTAIQGNYRIDIDFTENTRFRTQAVYTVQTDTQTPVVELVTDVLTLRDASYRYYLRGPFSLFYENELLRVEPVNLTSDEGVELTVEFEQYLDQAFRGRLEARDVNLAILQRIIMDDAIFDGMMNGSINLNVNIAQDEYNVDAQFTITDFDLDGFTLDVLNATTNLQDGRLTGMFSAVESADTLIKAKINLPFQPGAPIDFDDSFFQEEIYAQLESKDIVLEENAALSRLLGLEGVTGRVALSGSASGTAGEPEIDFGLGMTSARISGVALDSLIFNATYIPYEARFIIDTRAISSGQLAARVQGYIPLAIDMRTFETILPDEDNTIDLTVVTNDFNIAAFNQFADPALVRNIAGRINADMQIGGTFDDLELMGQLKLNSGNLFLVENNVTIRDIETDMRFTPDAIELNSLSMNSLGSLSGSGSISLDGFVPSEVDLSLRARNFRAYSTRDIQAIISMDTEITGGFENPKLTGSVQLDRGFLYLDNFGERTVEEVVLEEEDPSMFDGLEFYNNLEMELVIRTDRNFWVRNRARPEVELQLSGELDVIKYTGEEMQLFGSIGASDGYVNQLGRRFELEEAQVQFSGAPDDPQLNVRTLYELRQPSDIRIWYIIGGTAQEPTFSYESDPLMETGDIISYTLFGRPLNALSGWQQSVAGRSDGGVGDAAVEILLDRVEQLASQALGIDVLTIDNTRIGGQSGTTIKAGKFISDRIFVALIQELGATVSSQVLLEYQIRRNLDIIVTGSDNNRNGLEIQWKLDY